MASLFRNSESSEVPKEKIRYILQFLFDKGENSSKDAEILHGDYAADTLKASNVQFWLCRFGSVVFDVKDAPRIVVESAIVDENVDKIIQVIKVYRHVSNHSIAQELKI